MNWSEPTGDWRPNEANSDAATAFERAYRAGEQPRIEDYLAIAADAEARLRLLAELIHGELELRRRGGEPAQLAEYVARFPELAGRPAELASLVGAELRLRRVDGETLNLDEYRAFYTPLGIDVEAVFRRVEELRPELRGYELLGELGRGGMGVVYRARQLALRRDVALKLIRRDHLTADSVGDRFRARFRREAEAVAAVNHPGVVQIYEAGESGGDLFLAMELVDGPSLRRRLAEGGALAPRDAAELVRRAAEAVAAVHGRGIVHRDLKPDNILLAPDGAPKVADFGLARLAESGDAATGHGAILGTPGYLSPEQASGRSGEATPATDVYGLGAVLYACLTGQPPFQAATPAEASCSVPVPIGSPSSILVAALGRSFSSPTAAPQIRSKRSAGERLGSWRFVRSRSASTCDSRPS